MSGRVVGCLGKVLVLVLIVGIGAYVWWMNPGLLGRLRGGAEGTLSEPSPELAEATLDRFEAFQNAGGATELRLGDAELTSVVRYSLPGMLPPGVDQPTVRLADGHVYVSARVALESLPDIPALREVVGMLPDTVPVEIRGTLAPHDAHHARLHVDRIEASRIPLPARYIPQILNSLGRTGGGGLPAAALLVPLPRGLESAYVLGDSLVLVAGP